MLWVHLAAENRRLWTYSKTWQNPEKLQEIAVCLSACLSVCLPAYLSVCLSIYLSVCLSVFSSVWPWLLCYVTKPSSGVLNLNSPSQPVCLSSRNLKAVVGPNAASRPFSDGIQTPAA